MCRIQLHSVGIVFHVWIVTILESWTVSLLNTQVILNSNSKDATCEDEQNISKLNWLWAKDSFQKLTTTHVCTLSWKDFLFPELRTLTTMHWMNACSSFVCQSPFIFSHKTKEVWVSRASKCSRMQNKVQFEEDTIFARKHQFMYLSIY